MSKKRGLITYKNAVIGCSMLSIITLAGCNRVDAPVKSAAGRASQSMNLSIHRAQTSVTSQRMAPNRSSMAGGVAGRVNFKSYPAIARQIDAIPGLKWSVVLQEGTRAYVASFPQHVGGPKPGQAQRSGYNGPKLYDTKDELARKSPDVFIRALDEWHPRADTYDNRPRERSGYMTKAVQQQVRQVVRRALPSVSQVFITTDTASAALLRGYADYVQSGGDIRPYLKAFHSRTALIWPGGRGVSGNRPSAAPNFGAIGNPADARTPLPSHGHVTATDRTGH